MKTLINSILSKIGFSITRLDTIRYHEELLKQNTEFSKELIDYKGIGLKQLFSLFKLSGFNPNHIIDVGAHKGDWTREMLQYYPDSNYTLLEPQVELKKYTQDLISKRNIKWCTVGAGSNDGLLSFTYVDRADSRSFIYSEKEAIERGFRQEKIQVNRLDTLISSSDFGIPNVVKIDAEGLDIDVLIGMGEYLGKVEVIFVEVALACRVYKNTLEEVVYIMNKHDYRVFDVSDINRPLSNPVLWLMELVFVKKNCSIDIYNWKQ